MDDHQNTKIKNIVSPLRYPGSKKGLVGFIEEALQLNDMRPLLYIEPFVGGGSVAINLLKDDLVDKAILVDIDPWITSFWQTVFFDKAWLINQISNIDVNLEKWDYYKKLRPQTVRDQALTCLFLNRTNFSGILEERVGPLGGREQKSKYKIDCRFTSQTRLTIIDRIEQISSFQHRIYAIWNCSWIDALKRLRQDQAKEILPRDRVFFYFDPPFFEEAEALYRYFFLDKDHEELRDHLLELKDKWILSYDSDEKVKELYGDAIKNGTNGAQHHDFELLYSIAKVSKRKKGKEVIISNLEELPIPPSMNSNGVKKEK